MQRIDHGVKCLEDGKLIGHLKDLNMALTVCPLSNLEVSCEAKGFSKLGALLLPNFLVI